VNDTGATTSQHWLKWKYTNGVFDSTQTLTLDITDPYQDTTGTYYASEFFRSQGGWDIWVKGSDSTFQTTLAAPYSLSVNTIGGFFALEWQYVGDRELRFIIQRDTSGGSNWVSYDTVGVNVTVYNDSVTTSGTYKWRVAAERTNRSAYSTSGEITLTQAEYFLVFSPVNGNYTMHIQGTDSTVSFDFTNISGKDTIKVTALELPDSTIFRTNEPLPFSVLNNGTNSVQVQVKRNTTIGTKLDTLIVTHNGSSTKQKIPLQVLMVDTRDTTAPNPVTNFVATGYLDAGSSHVTGTWTGSTSTDVDRYAVEKGDAVGYPPASYVFLANVDFGINTFTDTLPSEGQLWAYKIKTIDDSSNISWVNPTDSALVPSVPAAPPPPNAPSNASGTPVAYTGHANDWQINWTFTDNSSNEDSFLIKIDGVNKYPSNIAGDVTYTSTLHANNSAHTFQVFAKNVNGTSAGSNIPSVTTVDTTTGGFPYGANAYFVSLNGQGNKNGSYGNDFDYPAVDWTNIGASDTLFFDGGASGVTYPTDFTVGSSGSSTGLLVIRPALETAHKGTVTFDLNGSGTAITVGTGDYIRLEKLTLADVGSGISYTDGSNVNYVDSCTIQNWQDNAIFCAGTGSNGYSDSLSIRWSTITHTDTVSGQVDAIHVKFISNFLIDGCYVYLDNRDYVVSSSGPGHSDVVQWFDSAENCVIKNSTFINLVGADTSMYVASNDVHHQTFMTEESHGTMIVYNCLILQPYGYGSTSNFAVKSDGGLSDAHWIFVHNTFLTRRSIINLRFKDLATIFKNNIVYSIEYPRNLSQFSTGTGSREANVFSQSGVTSWTQFDGNLFGQFAYDTDNLDVVRGTGAAFSMAEIFGAGGETTGNYVTRDRVNPLFTNLDISTPIWVAGDLDALDLSVQAGSPALNNGANLQSYIEGLGLLWKDKNGVTRDATPTVGAYELVSAGGSGDTLIIALIGDYGKAGTNENNVANLVKGWDPDEIITVGDNNYEDGAQSTIDANIGQYYRTFIYPYTGGYGAGSADNINHFWAVPGNHDWRAANLTPYKDYFIYPNNERYYYKIFNHNVRFYMIDSDSNEPDGTSSTSTQANYFLPKMDTSTATWDIAVFHHTAYSSGSTHGSETGMRWNWSTHGVDLLLAGHEHNYERVNTAGIVSVTDGLGGKSLYGFGAPISGSQIRYNAKYGATKITIVGNTLNIRHYTVNNEIIDNYTIVK
jgi:hypothetical protein